MSDSHSCHKGESGHDHHGSAMPTKDGFVPCVRASSPTIRVPARHAEWRWNEILVKGDLRGIVQAIALSRATMRNIRQNLLFASIYNALGVPIAAGVLYPFFGVLLSPIIPSAALAMSSVSVISNALRLKKTPL